MPFELIAALRFLREGRFQTVLILAGVAVGAAVIVFLVALITGLQDDLIARTLGTQPHIVLRPPDDAAQPAGQSIEWVKVHDLPDFVYFNHSAHVNKGVGCTTCHGPVDKMACVWQEESLLMEWCLDCHRQPEKYLRPKSEVFSTAWKAPSNQLELGRWLAAEYQVKTQVTCSTCHR